MTTLADLEDIINYDNMFVIHRLTLLSSDTMKSAVEALVSGLILPSDIIHLESITEASIQDLLAVSTTYQLPDLPEAVLDETQDPAVLVTPDEPAYLAGLRAILENPIYDDFMIATPFESKTTYTDINVGVSSFRQDMPIFKDIDELSEDFQAIVDYELPISLDLADMDAVTASLTIPTLATTDVFLFNDALALLERLNINELVSTENHMYRMWLSSNQELSLFTENSKFFQIFLNESNPVYDIKSYFIRSVEIYLNDDTIVSEASSILTDFTANSTIDEILSILKIHLMLIESEGMDATDLPHSVETLLADTNLIINHLNNFRDFLKALYEISRKYIY